MKAGVSSACLYPMLLEDAFKSLAIRGVKHTEIFVNTDCELRDPYLSEMLEIKNHYDIDVVSVHPFTCGIEPMMLFTRYERRVIDMLEYYKRFFDYMNKFGAKYFILHGNKKENPFPDNTYFERFALLQDTASTLGVSVLHENVCRCTAGNIDFLLDMAKNLGDKTKLVLDTKQAHRSGVDPTLFVQKLGKYIKHIHFSDFGDNGDCLKFGLGSYDNLAFFNELKKQNYNGNIMLELYDSNYNDIDDLVNNYISLENYLFDNGFLD